MPIFAIKSESILRGMQRDNSQRQMCQNVRFAKRAPTCRRFRQCINKFQNRSANAFVRFFKSGSFRIPNSEFRLLFLLHRLHLHSGLQQLQTGRDNFLAVLQSAFHNPFSFEKTTVSRLRRSTVLSGFTTNTYFNPCCELITLSGTSAAR